MFKEFERERQRDFKELAYMIVAAGKSKLAGWPAGWRSREELMLQLESKGSLESGFLCPRRTLVFSFKTFN